jgi:hypothetical protein
MIELAWLWLRHQPDSALSRWFQAGRRRSFAQKFESLFEAYRQKDRVLSRRFGSGLRAFSLRTGDGRELPPMLKAHVATQGSNPGI